MEILIIWNLSCNPQNSTHLSIWNSGPDGKLYVLEYGKGWFSKNPDAALSRIDYNSGELINKSAVTANTVPSTVDSAQFKQGHQEGDNNIIAGKTIMESLDCATCHKLNEKSIGPSFKDVSKKYADKTDAVNYLSGKIIKGSKGVWGETAMPAHPALPVSDAEKIVKWIISLK